MELKIPIIWDEDKLQEIVEKAVEKLKAEGYIWKEGQPVPYDWGTHNEQLLGKENS